MEFADVVPGPALGVVAGGVVVGAEVDELCVGVGEQRPDDHQDRAADRDDGPLLAATSGDPPISLAEEGVGAGGADRGLAEHPGQVAVALAAVRLPGWAAGGFVDSGCEPRPRGQVRRGRKAVMSVPISARIICAPTGPTPGIASSLATAAASSPICSSMRACTVAMSAVPASTRCSIWASRKAWWAVNRPVSASVSRADLDRR